MIKKFVLCVTFVAAAGVAVLPVAPLAAQRSDPAHLEAIGVLSATFAYQTYLNIGMLADANAKGVYEKDRSKQILQSVLNLVNLANTKLAAVGKTKLTPADKRAIESLSHVGSLLKSQGEALMKHLDAPTAETGQAFEASRQASWAELKKLLGIKE